MPGAAAAQVVGDIEAIPASAIISGHARLSSHLGTLFDTVGATGSPRASALATYNLTPGLIEALQQAEELRIHGTAVWTKVFGGTWNRDAQGMVAASEGWRHGVAAGAERAINEYWRAGVFGGYGRASIDYSTTETTDTQAGFGGFGIRFQGSDGLYGGVVTAFGYAWNDTTQHFASFSGSATYGSVFGGVIATVGKSIPFGSSGSSMRISTTGAYVGQWTDSYTYNFPGKGIVPPIDFTVDDVYTQAVDGRVEIAFENPLRRGIGRVEVFGGIVGHSTLGNEYNYILKLPTGSDPISISQDATSFVAGYAGIGLTTPISRRMGISTRGQVYKTSVGTIGAGGYFRLAGLF